MSTAPRSRHQHTLQDLHQRVSQGHKLVMLTAYDAPTAQIADAAEVDILLVGDSLGNVVLGYDNTLPVTVAVLAHHLEAVARTRPRAFLMADMPYLSVHLGAEEAIRAGGEFLRKGAQAVKVEGGAKRIPVLRALLDAEIPVMAHLGLTPQSLHAMGDYRVQGRDGEAAVTLLEDALRLQDAGCFAVLLEGIPAELAQRVTEALEVPTIGIGAGPHCTGQVLVFHDLLGLLPGTPPKFVRAYLDGRSQMVEAIQAWAGDIQAGTFPGVAESYMLPESARKRLEAWRPPLSKTDEGKQTKE